MAFYSWSQFLSLNPGFINSVSDLNFRDKNQSDPQKEIEVEKPSPGNPDVIKVNRLSATSVLLVLRKKIAVRKELEFTSLKKL